MPRTRGARDKKKRKQRSDKVLRYRKKDGKMQLYRSKRMRGDPIKIWVWEVREMKYDSIKRWNRKMQPRISKVVFKPGIRADVDPSDLSNNEVIGNWYIKNIGIPGEYLLKLFVHAKTPFHCTAKTVAKVTLTESKDGLHAVVHDNFRLGRYWFWKPRET